MVLSRQARDVLEIITMLLKIVVLTLVIVLIIKTDSYSQEDQAGLNIFIGMGSLLVVVDVVLSDFKNALYTTAMIVGTIFLYNIF